MENKNRGVVFCQLNLMGKTGPNAKMRKKCKKLSNIEKIFLGRFAHSAFYNIHIPGAADRHAPVQYAKYVFFFLSRHHDTNPLLHLYHFRKNIIIYWLILTVNHQGSYFPFFLSSPSGSNIFVPQQILKPFEAQC